MPLYAHLLGRIVDAVMINIPDARELADLDALMHVLGEVANLWPASIEGIPS